MELEMYTLTMVYDVSVITLHVSSISYSWLFLLAFASLPGSEYLGLGYYCNHFQNTGIPFIHCRPMRSGSAAFAAPPSVAEPVTYAPSRISLGVTGHVIRPILG
jgi:hypothetical protein